MIWSPAVNEVTEIRAGTYPRSEVLIRRGNTSGASISPLHSGSSHFYGGGAFDERCSALQRHWFISSCPFVSSVRWIQ